MKMRNVRGTFLKGLVLLGIVILFPFALVYSADKIYWAIQVSSYETEASAKKDLERLKIRQFPNSRIEKVPESAYPYRLLIGRFTTRDEVDPMLRRAQSLFPEAFKRSFTLPVSSAPASPKGPEPSKVTSPKPPPAGTVSKAVEPLPKEQVRKKTALPEMPRSVQSPPAPAAAIPLPTPLSGSKPEMISEVLPTEIVEEPPAEIAPLRVSFEDLGYPKETYLAGSSPEFVFYLFNSKGLTHAEADLTWRLSSVLSNKSTLTVEIDDIPLFTKSIQEVGYTPRLSFPIPLSKNDHIKVVVKGHLFVTEDKCEDLSSGNLWMVMANTSQLILTEHSRPSESISDFFRNYKKAVNVILDPATASFEALPLFYYIHPLNDWRKINILLNKKPSEAYSTLRVGRYSQDIEVKAGELRLYEEKVYLLRKSLQPLMITPSISNATISEEDRKEGVLRFSDLDVKNFSATGSGNLSLSLPLRYSFFSGIPRNLTLELRANHTPIPEGDKAFLRIFLNRLLLSAVQLEKGGKQHTYHVEIPEELLNTFNNTLEMTTSYFPNQGGCGGSAPQMTFSISNDSRFYYRSATREGIHSVVDVMGSLSGKVLLMIDDRKMFIPGMDLLHLLGQFNKDIRHIDVRPWGGEILKGYDFVVLLLTPENTRTLPLPLKLDQGRFSIMNPITKKNLFGLAKKEDTGGQERVGMDYQSPFGVLQTLDHGDAKILLLSYHKDVRALKFLQDINPADMGRFNGNIVLFNQNLTSYSVGNKFRVVYQEARSVPYYWSRLKLPIILGGVFVLLVFLYYVNKKLVRE